MSAMLLPRARIYSGTASMSLLVLQEIASPAGICISGAVREQTEGKLDFHLSQQSASAC